MSDSLRAFDRVLKLFLNGTTTSTVLLSACSVYLAASGDWQEVRDVLRDDLKMDQKACLEWFSFQDFPDFREAVDEGWGWDAD